jgi:hypothetical protein
MHTMSTTQDDPIIIPVTSDGAWLTVGAQSWKPREFRVRMVDIRLKKGGMAEAVALDFIPSTGSEGKWVAMSREEALALAAALIETAGD